MKLKLFLALLLLKYISLPAQNVYQIDSPGQKLKVEVSVGEQITFSLIHEETEVLSPSSISMTLKSGEVLGAKPQIAKVTRKSTNKEIVSPYYKREEVPDIYNEMTISFSGNYSLVFRVYDEGFAYRFVTTKGGDIVVANEEANYCFPSDFMTYSSYVNTTKRTFEEQFFNSFEQPYNHLRITELNSERLLILPLLVELGDGKKLCITEVDLEDYPGMYLNNTSDNPSFKAVFAPNPKVTEQGGHNQLQALVKEYDDFIAKTKGTRSFPWRTFIVSENDKELADCDMVYKLASPSRIRDISWIKPGKVAWDWWNAWGLYDVDFVAGVNNETYKYYIDFASRHGIEYVILDEGWAVNLEADMLQVIPEIDIPELVTYGKERNVDIILWAGYWAFNRDMERVVRHYSEMGIKGFKIDFMDRDDQEMVNFLYRSAEVCARYQMLVDFHGVFKPTGLQRTYPNVVNYEGVNGLEQLKWSPASYDMVTYDVTIPFIRMVAGPMDYTQGAMRNAAKGNYRPVNSEPMSQGTRCRQLATYVIFESPLNMLCDSPSNYMRESECTSFIAKIPTVWDETIVLDGKVAEYVVIARRKGNDWYIGGLTNWEAREVELDLSFLDKSYYTLELFKDGTNAHRIGRDYKKEIVSIPENCKFTVKMASGGGFAVVVQK